MLIIILSDCDSSFIIFNASLVHQITPNKLTPTIVLTVSFFISKIVK